MRKFTKIIAPALVVALGFTAVAPAMAQVAPRHENSRYENNRNDNVRYQNTRQNDRRVSQNQNSRLRSDIQRLRSDIDRAEQRRTISKKQATNLRRDASETQRLYTNYARNGLTSNETRTLENRVGKIRNALIDDRQRRPGL